MHRLHMTFAGKEKGHRGVCLPPGKTMLDLHVTHVIRKVYNKTDIKDVYNK